MVELLLDAKMALARQTGGQGAAVQTTAASPLIAAASRGSAFTRTIYDIDATGISGGQEP